MSGDAGRVNAQTTSPSSQCGFNLDSASQRGLYRLVPRVCHPSGRHTLQSANLDFLNLDAEEIATLPRFTPWQTEKISSSRLRIWVRDHMSLLKRTMFRKWIDGHPDMMGWH